MIEPGRIIHYPAYHLLDLLPLVGDMNTNRPIVTVDSMRRPLETTQNARRSQKLEGSHHRGWHQHCP
jgi:hypothetical protein